MKIKHSRKSLILVLSVMLPAAALIVGCFPPNGFGGDPRAQGTTNGVQLLDVSPPALQIQETVNPSQVYVKGSGLGNEVTTITIAVTGYGGTTTTTAPMDVVFAIDSSGSMGVPTQPTVGSDPTGLRMTAAKSFVDRLNPASDRAAVVSWDEGIDFTYPPTAPYPVPGNYSVFTSPPAPALTITPALTGDFAVLKSQIDTVNAEGNTNLAMGLQQSIRMLDVAPRAGAVAAIIFLTDGADNATWPAYILTNWVAYAKTRGYRIYSIGLGSSVVATPLQTMATQTGGRYYSAPSADNLQALYDQIYTEVVSSTAPSAVNVVEVTREYIVDQGSFSVTPDSVVTDAGTGETTITWLNAAAHVGNNDDRLASDETFSVSFKASASLIGADLPVNAASAAVTYLDPTTAAQSQPLPQALVTVTGKIIVTIDIKPRSDKNTINIERDEVIPVAILTTDTFNALTVDPTTVIFAGAHQARMAEKIRLARRFQADVNNDGRLDLVLYFRLNQTSLTSASTEGVLTGLTYGGIPIEGKDFVRMVHDRDWFHHRDCDGHHDWDDHHEWDDHRDCDGHRDGVDNRDDGHQARERY